MELNDAAQIIHRRPSARAACLAAIVCLVLLAASLSYAALADARVIRVTAADIAKLPARENYVVDLRRSNVVYDLDGTARAIDWRRVRIRKADGDVALLTHLRERFPKLAEQTPTRLVIGGASGGIWKVLKLKDAPDDGTEYKCEGALCECKGARDCKKMIRQNACADDVATCTIDPQGFFCQCDAR